jgi:hypothetical protein
MTAPDIIHQLVKRFDEHREIESTDRAIGRFVYELSRYASRKRLELWRGNDPIPPKVPKRLNYVSRANIQRQWNTD